jgi:hypothetical protein
MKWDLSLVLMEEEGPSDRPSVSLVEAVNITACSFTIS